MELVAVLGTALITAVLALVLKERKSEYALLVSAAGGCVIFYLVLQGILTSLSQINNYFTKIGVESGYFVIVLKALGICYITQFVSDLCRDYGQTSLAGRVDLAGKCCILLLSAPLLEQLINIAVKYIG